MTDPKSINFLPKNELIEFAADAEPWSQYRLENGAILRVRTVLVKVADTGQFTPDGFPIYNTRLEQMMDMTLAAGHDRDCGCAREVGRK